MVLGFTTVNNITTNSAGGEVRLGGGDRRRAIVLGWALTLSLNVALPIATYSLLTGWGVRSPLAFLASGAWPVLDAAARMTRGGPADPINIVALIVTALGAISSLAFDDARAGVAKNGALTGAFSVALLVSLLREKPLMFYFGRRFATDGTAEGVERWNGYWKYADFRRSQRVMTVVWGLAFVAEAGCEVLAAVALPISGALALNNLLPYAVLAGLMTLTFAYGKRVRAASMRRMPREAA